MLEKELKLELKLNCLYIDIVAVGYVGNVLQSRGVFCVMMYKFV